jgi:hypothetical protein
VTSSGTGWIAGFAETDTAVTGAPPVDTTLILRGSNL